MASESFTRLSQNAAVRCSHGSVVDPQRAIAGRQIYRLSTSDAGQYQTLVPHFAWVSDVWSPENSDSMIHFNGDRFLGPYPDGMLK